MLGPIYGKPNLLADMPLEPGCIVEHKLLLGVGLRIISGPHQGVTGDIYRVLMPGGFGRLDSRVKVAVLAGAYLFAVWCGCTPG